MPSRRSRPATRPGKRTTTTRSSRPGPVVLLVNGLPGSGKSTLGAQLSAGLGIALFSKDAYKESLWDSDRLPTAAESSRLGRIAAARLWSDVGAHSGPALVESFWFAPRDRELLAEDLAAAGRTVAAELWCGVEAATARQRCRDRQRHAVHHPAHEDEQLWQRWAQQAEPLGFGRTLRVSTEGAVDLEALRRQVLPLLEPETPEPEVLDPKYLS